jgi:hypothetical protein
MTNMQIARVFPRKTKASPDDALAFFGPPPVGCAVFDRVLISCTFTWDMPRAEELAQAWRGVCGDVQVGGPAYGTAAGDFEPGMFVKHGYTITTRGCNNRCWYCYVHKREGGLRELPIREGSNVLDSNLLQASEGHIGQVFDMLNRQPRGSVRFTGGLEAKLIDARIARELRIIRPKALYCANDRPGDTEHLRSAAEHLFTAGFTKTSHVLSAYVLCGYAGDTMAEAEKRMRETWDAGFVPYAMLWKNAETGESAPEWRAFQRTWVRPQIILAQLRGGSGDRGSAGLPGDRAGSAVADIEGGEERA